MAQKITPKKKRHDGGETVKKTEKQDALIRRLAQELYVRRGGVPGNELDDWLEAERRVLNNLIHPGTILDSDCGS